MSELWVFGYGSLIWRPGFAFLERRPALLIGAHRSLCVYSWVHRGTKQRPGLVLGLDRGGACRGVAFRIAPQERENVLAYLREREQVTDVYLERMREVRFAGGGRRVALAYLVDRGHPQYAGRLGIDTQFTMVLGARGRSGENAEYVINTVTHLAELGIADAELEELARRLTAFQPAQAQAASRR
jgi:cation transport protein ChaC